MRIGKAGTAVAVTAVVVACAAPAAQAATCTYAKKTRTVSMALGATESGSLQVSGGVITGTGGDVRRGGACGKATVSNTDAVRVTAPAGSAEFMSISLADGGFAPGATGETDGASEIELSVDLGGWDPNWFTRDELRLQGTAGEDFIALGGDGFALNRDGDLDIAVAGHPAVDPIQAGPDIDVVGDLGADEITAQGGSGAGAPYAGYYELEVWGGPGDFIWDDAPNRLTGGEGHDRLNGGYGTAANTIDGAGGDDGVFGSLGDDLLTGGPGPDSLWGDDGIDALDAGAGDDGLHGGSGDDRLDAGDGNDQVDGDTGNDDVAAGAGDDFITADDGYRDMLFGGDGLDRAFADSFDEVPAGDIEERF